MMLNAQVTQIWQLSQKTPKNSTNAFWPIINWSCMRWQRSWRYQKAMYSSFCMNICQWESCVQRVCCVCSQSIKKHVDDWEYCLPLFQCNKKELLCKYVTMCETWIHHFTLEWQQQVKAVQSDQRCKHQQVLASVFWDAQGILFIDYLEKGRTINSKNYIALLVHLKEEIAKKMTTNEEGKSALSPRQCTMSQVDCNKTTWIALQIASTPTLFSRSGLQWLLAVCRPQKNAPGKEIWLQWRSDIGNWGVFWGKRQIVLQKRYWIVKEALESVYHPGRRLCWWIKSNFS